LQNSTPNCISELRKKCYEGSKSFPFALYECGM